LPNPQDPQNPSVYAITITERAKFIAYGRTNFGNEKTKTYCLLYKRETNVRLLASAF